MDQIRIAYPKIIVPIVLAQLVTFWIRLDLDVTEVGEFSLISVLDEIAAGHVGIPKRNLLSFHLEFSSFWILRLFDLGDLSVLENGSLKYFENGLKSMQIFQRFMGGMNRR